MAMYECEECGEEYGNFPKIFLAVNSDAPKYPDNNHETEFEVKFDELWTPTGVEHYDPKGWEKFWSWLGDKKIRWFCSVKCAENYLAKTHIEKASRFELEGEE